MVLYIQFTVLSPPQKINQVTITAPSKAIPPKTSPNQIVILQFDSAKKQKSFNTGNQKKKSDMQPFGQQWLGGGFKCFVIFTPICWRFLVWLYYITYIYFSDRLKPPTHSNHLVNREVFFASFETFFLAMEPESFIHHCASCGKAEAIDSKKPTETSASCFLVEFCRLKNRETCAPEWTFTAFLLSFLSYPLWN